MFFQCLQYRRQQQPIAQLLDGYIDCHWIQRKLRDLPQRQLTTHCFNDPVSQRDDQVILFGKWNKIIWIDQAMLRMLPTYERFQTDDIEMLQIELGLVMQTEFIGPQ